MKNKPIGRIDPVLKIRIDSVQHQIDYVLDTYSIYGYLDERVRKVLDKLFERKEMLVNRI